MSASSSHQQVFNDRDHAMRYAKEQAFITKRMAPQYFKSLHKREFTAGKILDAGSGPGHIAIALAKEFPKAKITGIDLSEPLLEFSSEPAKIVGVTDRVTFEKGDVTNLPYEDNSFNVVISQFMFHFIENRLLMMNEIERVLKPDGILLLKDIRKSWVFGLLEKEFRVAFTPAEAKRKMGETKIRPGRFTADLITFGFEA